MTALVGVGYALPFLIPQFQAAMMVAVAGAAWLMVSLGAGPAFVALTQTASTLPFFLLALPAGATDPQTEDRHAAKEDRCLRRTRRHEP
jgi:transmembrane secretion effector